MKLLSHFLMHCFLSHLPFFIVRHFVFSCKSSFIFFHILSIDFYFTLFLHFDLLVEVMSLISMYRSFAMFVLSDKMYFFNDFILVLLPLFWPFLSDLSVIITIFYVTIEYHSLYRKRNLLLRISSVNMIKSADLVLLVNLCNDCSTLDL